MNKIEELRKQAVKISNEIYAIEKAEIERKRIPEIKNMVGWCMKSNYGGKSEKTYQRILEWVKNEEYGIYFIMEKISLNNAGEVSFGITSEIPYTNKEWWDTELPLYGYKRISSEIYEQEKTKLLNEITSRNLLRKWIIKNKN